MAKEVDSEVLEDRGGRRVYSVSLQGLASSEEYSFVIVYLRTMQRSRVYKFNSLPFEKEDEVRFALWQNLQNHEERELLTQAVADTRPHVVLVSPDVNSDYGMPECYYLWDEFLDHWQRNMLRDGNALIPMVITAGKHELGANTHDVLSHVQRPFFTFFPQNFPVSIEDSGR